jgi:hypothetical protein
VSTGAPEKDYEAGVEAGLPSPTALAAVGDLRLATVVDVEG